MAAKSSDAFRLIGAGEVLWDLLPGGRQLGGAPANFTYHARALGVDARLISCVGDDALGKEALERLTSLGVPTDCIECDPTLPTGTVDVIVRPDGQPDFTIHEHVAWDALSGEKVDPTLVASADAVCFGTLGQRTESAGKTIRSLVAMTPPGALRVFDINIRQHFYSPQIIEQSLELANVLKINETELPLLAKILGLTGDVRSQIERVAEGNDLRCVAYTRGGQGSLLFAEGQWSDHPGVPVKVIDAVGAGDAFTAAMTLGMLLGWNLDEVNQGANEVAAFVASCPGATPDLPEACSRVFRR